MIAQLDTARRDSKQAAWKCMTLVYASDAFCKTNYLFS